MNMETIVKVVQLSSQRTEYFRDLESFFNQFFNVWSVKDYHWKTSVINVDIINCSSSILFDLDDDSFVLSFEKVHVTNPLNYIS